MCNYKTINLNRCRPWDRQTRLFFFSNSFWVQQEWDRFSPPEDMELTHSKHRHSDISSSRVPGVVNCLPEQVGILEISNTVVL